MGYGVNSSESDSMMLAGVPDTPSSAPTRDSSSSYKSIVVELTAVTGTNGSPITSYCVLIDNGMGGTFTEL